MSGRALTSALAAANIAAAAIAIWPFLPERAPTERALAAPAGASDTPTLVRLPPMADLKETLARPLFAPTRRPEPGAATAGPGAGIETRYRLQGLVIAGTARRAIIAAAAGGQTLTLAEGDTLEGWVVKRIAQDRVLLTSPAGEATLDLQRPSAKR